MSETKDTNPKDAVGVKKAPMHNVPCRVLMETGLSMMEGSCKYGSHNYRDAGVRASVYYDAAMRHLMAWWEGEDIDPDSGVHHTIKAITCLVVLRDSMHMGNWVDDRPPRLPSGLDVPELNKIAARLVEKYPHAVTPFTEVGRQQSMPTSPTATEAESAATCGECYYLFGKCPEHRQFSESSACSKFKPKRGA